MNIEMTEVERRWQEVLRRRFQGVIVRELHHIPEDDDWPFLGVFMLPDESGPVDFQNYRINELWKIEEDEKLPPANLLRYTVSQTKHYPRIWQLAQEERRAGKASSRSVLSRARKPLKSNGRPKKSARPHAVAR